MLGIKIKHVRDNSRERVESNNYFLIRDRRVLGKEWRSHLSETSREMETDSHAVRTSLARPSHRLGTANQPHRHGQCGKIEWFIFSVDETANVFRITMPTFGPSTKICGSRRWSNCSAPVERYVVWNGHRQVRKEQRSIIERLDLSSF